MKQKPTGRPSSSDQIIRDIKRKTRKQYGAEEKIRIVLDGLRGEDSIAELCRREGIAQSLYYKWSKDFMEAGKKRLAGDIVRAGQHERSDRPASRSPRSQRGGCRTNAGAAATQKKYARGWGGTRMRYPASEKLEIIQLVERSHLPAKQTLDMLDIPRTTFYRWYARFRLEGQDALRDKAPLPGRIWNRIPDAVRDSLITLALDRPELSPRELAVTFTDSEGYFVSESSVYRLLKAHDLITSPAFIVIKAASEFKDKTTAINQMWQTDFTYLKIIGWGWMYLSTILDDFSRYVIAWKLCTSMTSRDVTETLELALQASGCDQADVVQKPRLLSDNGSSYISSELADWITDNGMSHVRGAPYHPQTQGKIERWHQTLKNRILLEHYFLPGDLEKQIEAFVDHYNHQRYHESLKNLTPADVYFGRGQSILASRERIKKRTIAKRSLHYQQHAA